MNLPSHLELFTRLIWHLPLPQQTAIYYENQFIDLDKKGQFVPSGTLDEIVHSIIHYENKPFDYMLQFIKHLNIDDVYKEDIIDEISEIDLNDSYKLFELIFKYIESIDPIPMG